MRADELELAREWRIRLASGDARRRRQAVDVSAAEVARVIRVSRAAVCDWERAKKRPTRPHAIAYGRLLTRWETRGTAA